MQAITHSTLMTNMLNARAERIKATPGTEEVVNPLTVAPKPAATDPVSISEQAQELQKIEEIAKNAPRIDWENRTRGGKKIPDNIHKELTPEMISGEQNYSAIMDWTSGTIYYKEEKFSEKERVLQSDLQKLSGMQQHVQSHENMVQEYALRSQAIRRNPDPIATSVMDKHGVTLGGLTQKILEETVLSYTKLGIDLLEAHNMMEEMSLGQFSLADMLKDYFGVDIRN